MLRKNPSRFVRYLSVYELGTNMMHLGSIIQSRVTTAKEGMPAKK
jgi:hypothetical protein